MRNVFGSITKKGARVAVTAAFALATSGSAWAASTISSNATDLQVSLSLLGITPSLTVGTASGSGPGAYSNSNSPTTVNTTLGLGTLLGQSVSTGLLSASASSDGTTGQANATVNGLTLGLNALFTSFLSVSSGVISSTTTFDGSSFLGVSSIANLAVNSAVLTLPLNASALVSTAANRTLVDILGLKITLNEQIASDTTSNGINTRSLTTNALHVSYNDFAFGGGLLNGDVIVGQSQVIATQPVPEPATWAMMILGFGMIGAMLRRHKRTAVATPA
ncbi:PEP-CTERM sorting domain-containing protein [Sphingomonas sp. AP4-R1]|uniref:PEPxxWA-CTERM sorting domain-containing protein n=1 Tax=Sphingomonas sp. AP4-R1 TaxID=2735134 RepID=UPI0014938F24|nr:PEPxxWA-CTERM sorting domain-containing protein [Sphingomonas sp. AP4-R1]QJU58625.1 PEP-CTERM sorting domain-containing protein [Sphingomonas sp. AP4-R1]